MPRKTPAEIYETEILDMPAFKDVATPAQVQQEPASLRKAPAVPAIKHYDNGGGDDD